MQHHVVNNLDTHFLLTGRMRGKKVKAELIHPWVRQFYNNDDEANADVALTLIETDEL